MRDPFCLFINCPWNGLLRNAFISSKDPLEAEIWKNKNNLNFVNTLCLTDKILGVILKVGRINYDNRISDFKRHDARCNDANPQ